MGLWSVIVPEATVNLITNPSFETTGAGGWTAVGGSVARSAAYSAFGLYSLAVTPTSGTGDGVYFGTVALTSGTSYTFSVYVRGVASVPYKIYFADTSGTLKGTATTITGDGAWHRYEVTWACDSSTNYRVYVTKNGGSSTGVFYIDAAQVEANAYATTYCDGSIDVLRGFSSSGCSWSGVAHASTSSRTATSRMGGRVRDLTDIYGLYVTGHIGGAAPPVEVITSAYIALDGAFYDNTTVQARTLSVLGKLVGSSLADFQSKRSNLIGVLFPNSQREPVLLRYAGSSRTLEIAGHYAGGLEGGELKGYSEAVSISFVCPYPHWREVVV